MKEKRIRYYSTNHRAPETGFREALLKGLAPDGGLYLPDHVPHFAKEEIAVFKDLPYYETASVILQRLLQGEIPSDDLSAICRDAYTFEVPVEKIDDRRYILRLDRGPTASFKDFAARMMARLMNYFITEKDLKYTILTATSGDTGSAVASAFHGLSNIEVVILFPAGEVSEIQRKQMTTFHGNVSVIAIDGKFDDCQKLVKTAFLDPALSHIPLSSANSINIGRLLPQTIYYFHAWAVSSVETYGKIVFSVPSGNFGNLMGGVIARRMGLPVSKFIIATNSNYEVPEYLATGQYKPLQPSRNCISSAMNVGHPSNLARIIAFYGGTMNEAGVITAPPDLQAMRSDFDATSISDEETRKTIISFHDRYGLLLEPHGAVAWKGLENFTDQHMDHGDQVYVAVETAHPAKFREEVESLTGVTLSLPDSLIDVIKREEKYINMDNNYDALKDFILSLKDKK